MERWARACMRREMSAPASTRSSSSASPDETTTTLRASAIGGRPSSSCCSPSIGRTPSATPLAGSRPRCCCACAACHPRGACRCCGRASPGRARRGGRRAAGERGGRRRREEDLVRLASDERRLAPCQRAWRRRRARGPSRRRSLHGTRVPGDGKARPMSTTSSIVSTVICCRNSRLALCRAAAATRPHASCQGAGAASVSAGVGGLAAGAFTPGLLNNCRARKAICERVGREEERHLAASRRVPPRERSLSRAASGIDICWPVFRIFCGITFSRNRSIRRFCIIYFSKSPRGLPCVW